MAAAKPPKNYERAINMNELQFELYWHDIPVGKENAADYATLCLIWGTTERRVRQILHKLSCYDNGDNYVLVRSARGKGFYKTDDRQTIEEYKQECLNKGKSIFAPVKKINRIQRENGTQYSLENNLRVVREAAGLTQGEVCEAMKDVDRSFDKPMLSKMENGFCLPTPAQLAKLAKLYGCETLELISPVYF